MSTDAISSYFSSSYLTQNSLTLSGLSQSSNSTSSTGLTSALRVQIDALLENIPKGDDGTLSFQDVEDYLESEEEKWDEEVKADLEALGVTTSESFPLVWDATNGTVTVSDGHPDKAIIDQYFADNPDKVAKFEEIIQIGKLTNVSSSNLSPTELMTSIQQQSMSIWYEDNSDPTTWFSGGGLLFGAGQSTYTGLNITV